MEVSTVIVFPLLTALVLAVLTASVWGQWRQRHRPHQLAWTFSLGAGLVGALAYVATVLAGDSAWLFRLYYMGGAVLIAPLLGVGSAYLLPNRLWARLLLGLTVVGALLSAVGLATHPLDGQALAALGGGPGTGAVTAPLAIVPLIVLNSLGTVAVVGVALRSLALAAFRQRPWNLVWGNALIAGGTLIVAAAGSLARLGQGAGFWGTMSAGWIVLYAGFALMSAVVVEARAAAA